MVDPLVIGGIAAGVITILTNRKDSPEARASDISKTAALVAQEQIAKGVPQDVDLKAAIAVTSVKTNAYAQAIAVVERFGKGPGSVTVFNGVTRWMESQAQGKPTYPILSKNDLPSAPSGYVWLETTKNSDLTRSAYTNHYWEVGSPPPAVPQIPATSMTAQPASSFPLIPLINSIGGGQPLRALEVLILWDDSLVQTSRDRIISDFGLKPGGVFGKFMSYSLVTAQNANDLAASIKARAGKSTITVSSPSRYAYK